jgi:subtilisin family serine protease
MMLCDLTAPGAQIVSTALNNGYSIGSGTSFAAPQVTGVLALMHDYFTQLTDEQRVAQLLSTTLDRGTIGYDVYYGFGVVQAAHALDVEFVTILFETSGGTSHQPDRSCERLYV